MDIALLIVGGFRVAAFALGAFAAWHHKSVLGVVGFGLATATATVFALSNADAHVPRWLFTASSYTSTPTAMLIVAAFVITAKRRTGWDW